MNIFEKLSAIQNELKAPKSQFNSFGKYAYRSCEDITEAAKPVCSKYKTVFVMSDKLIEVGGRNYVESTVTLYDCESTEKIVVTASAREEESKKGMDGSQITGSSSSYARKYALGGLFDLDDTKDSDATNEGEKPPQKAQEKVKEITVETLTEAGIQNPQAMIDWLEKAVGYPVAMFSEADKTRAWLTVNKRAKKNAGQAQESVQ